MGHTGLIAGAADLLARVPRRGFSGTVYRICLARYRAQMLSVRGSLQHEGRFNVRGLFGALYTSLDRDTAEAEMARYFTVPPKEGFTVAAVEVRLSAVADLTRLALPELTGADHGFCQSVGQLAWEAGLEGLLAPSAARTGRNNLAVLVDNQHPGWMLRLKTVG